MLYSSRPVASLITSDLRIEIFPGQKRGFGRDPGLDGKKPGNELL